MLRELAKSEAVTMAWEKKQAAEKKRRRVEARRQELTDDILEKLYGSSA